MSRHQGAKYRGISKDRSGATTEALDDYQRCSEQGDAKTLLWRANLDIKSGFLDAAERDLQALRAPRSTATSRSRSTRSSALSA